MCFSTVLKGKQNKRIIICATIFIIALCLRVTYYVLEGNVSRDGVKYVLLAEEWNETGDFEHASSTFSFMEDNNENWIPPLLLSIILFFIKLDVDPKTWTVVFNILCGSLLVIPIFELGLVLSDSLFFSALAAFFVACNSSLCDNSADILREPLYLLFSTYMLLFAGKAVKTKRIILWFAVGAFQGLAFLSRIEAIEYWVWMIFFLVFLLIMRQKNIFRIGLYYYASSILVILAVSGLLGTEKQLFHSTSRVFFHLTGKYL